MQRLAERVLPLASQFGRIVAHSSGLPMRLAALDSRSFPSAMCSSDVKEAFLCLTGPSALMQTARDILDKSKIDERSDGGLKLSISALANVSGLEFCLHVPFSVDIKASTSDAPGSSTAADLWVNNFEGGNFALSTQRGNVTLKGVKGASMDIVSESGRLSASSLQGNVKVTTREGSILLGKLQTEQCTLSAGRHIVVDALYGKQTRFLSHGGDVAVGDAHGDLEVVASKQSIYLGSYDGAKLRATAEKNIKVHLDRLERGELKASRGHVQVSLDPRPRWQVEVVGSLNEERSQTTAGGQGAFMRLSVTVPRVDDFEMEEADFMAATRNKAKMMRHYRSDNN